MAIRTRKWCKAPSQRCSSSGQRHNFSIYRKEEAMRKIAIVGSLACVLVAGVVRIEGQDQHPILDQVANKVIQKYQTSTCQQLWAERAQKAPPSPQEQKATQF